jgi:spore maturation protein CgeB
MLLKTKSKTKTILMEGFLYDSGADQWCKRVFSEFGHQVFTISPKSLPFFNLRYLNRIALIEYNYEIIQLAKKIKPDVFFSNTTKLLYRSTIAKLKSLGVITVCWWQDLPQLYPQWQNYIYIFDYFFTFIPDHDLRFLGKKLSNVYYLPLAASSNFTPRQKNFKNDICFVGTYYKQREEILKTLTNLSAKLKIYGGQEWGKSNLALFYAGAPVFDEELLIAYRDSKVGLNLHQDYGLPSYAKFGINFRAFEIPASGAMQIVDYKEEIERFFEPGKEVVCFHNLDELKELIKFYLKNDAAREKIAKAGNIRAAKEHSLSRRLQELLNIIDSNS